MNELIERLAREAGLIGMRPHLDGIYAKSLETFARAVARECAEIAGSWSMGKDAHDEIRERFDL